MPILNIRHATTRDGMKLIISLFGLSESGKTYSAVQLMAGIEPDPTKRGFLDSEGGSRGLAYTDSIKGGYMYGALSPPFTAERYMEALQDFVDAGVTTLVVDSVSHVWFAEGGVLDIVENATEKNDMAKWAKPKRRLGKLTNKWLQSNLHLILCARAKQTMVEQIIDGKKKYVKGPIVPIQEKMLRYDLTVIAQMQGFGKFSIHEDVGGKCPGTIRDVFNDHGVMDEEMGRKLLAWVGGQDMLTSKQRSLIMRVEEIADKGMDALTEMKGKLNAAQLEFLTSRWGNLESIAKSADTDKARAEAERLEAEHAESDEAATPFAQRAATKLQDTLPGGPENTLADLTVRLETVTDSETLAGFLQDSEVIEAVNAIRPFPNLVAEWMASLADLGASFRQSKRP